MSIEGDNVAMEFKDNSKDILKQFEKSKIQALTAIGQAVTEVAIDYALHKYPTPAYQTGDLVRDINSKVRPQDYMVDIGNTVSYSTWVHNGTRTMVARPYLRDAILDNPDMWEEIAAEYLGE